MKFLPVARCRDDGAGNPCRSGGCSGHAAFAGERSSLPLEHSAQHAGLPGSNWYYQIQIIVKGLDGMWLRAAAPISANTRMLLGQP
jgi:hypothetical protein